MSEQTIDQKLRERDLQLPALHEKLKEVKFPFDWVRIRGSRALVSGHVPLAVDGSMCGPFGKVGKEVSEEQAYAAARITTLAMLGSLQRALGSLDRITAWIKVLGFVNATSDFKNHPKVMNGCSDLILDLFGEEVGAHARSAIGVGSLPFHNAIEIEAEVEISLS